VFDLRWLQATDEQVRAAVPPGSPVAKAKPLRGTAITGAVALVVAVAGTTALASAGVSNGFLGFLLTAAFIVAACCGIALLIRRGSRNTGVTDQRLDWVAAANGFFHNPSGLPAVDTMLLHAGHDVDGKHFFWNAAGDEFGSISYTTGSGKSQSAHHWHYVAARLPAPLPRMVLDATSNNFLGTDLPQGFARDQHVELEGDFDKHFTLYAPLEYQQDALYVFTPDVMASFIDNASRFNVEIIDDTVIFLAQPGADYRRPEPWFEAEQLFATAIAELKQRASRYLDDRVAGQPVRAIDQAAAYAAAVAAAAPASPGEKPGVLPDAPAAASFMRPTIAPQGRRLKTRGVWGIGAVIFLGWIAISIVNQVITHLLR